MQVDLCTLLIFNIFWRDWTKDPKMRQAVKYVLSLAAAFICLAVALFEWSSYTDEKRFAAAINECERKCIQDSGGLDQCRKDCADHPDRYP
jgi:hypothetical protein